MKTCVIDGDRYVWRNRQGWVPAPDHPVLRDIPNWVDRDDDTEDRARTLINDTRDPRGAHQSLPANPASPDPLPPQGENRDCS